MFCTDYRGLLVQAPAAALRRMAGRRGLTLLKHRQALGDALMLSALARAFKHYLPRRHLAIASPHPELFEHNPHFDEVRGWHLFRTASTVCPRYRLENGRHPHYVEALWVDLWDELGARGWVSKERPPLRGRHPEIFLTDGEKARGRELLAKRKRPVVVLVSGGKLKPTHNREWGHANYVALAGALAPHVDLLQISGARELALPGDGRAVRNIRVSIREVAAVLAACDAFVTQEGGLMHVARAVEAPTVVIYGGALWPEHSGYDRMTNLFSQPECSPCRAARRDCAHLKCMTRITPRVVAQKIAELFRARGLPLPEEAVAAAPDEWTPPDFVERNILEEELRARPVAPVATFRQND